MNNLLTRACSQNSFDLMAVPAHDLSDLPRRETGDTPCDLLILKVHATNQIPTVKPPLDLEDSRRQKASFLPNQGFDSTVIDDESALGAGRISDPVLSGSQFFNRRQEKGTRALHGDG